MAIEGRYIASQASYCQQIAIQVLPQRQVSPDNGGMKIGLVIKALRSERGLSQEALALEVDTATSNLSRIEKGLRTPSLDLLYRLAEALGVKMSEMFRAEEGGDLPAAGKVKGTNLQEEGGDYVPDYADDAVQIRRVFRELTPHNREVALELLKALKVTQSA